MEEIESREKEPPERSRDFAEGYDAGYFDAAAEDEDLDDEDLDDDDED